ncbi:hypothetical protein [Streptomyces swartbergensis]|nr:hypothetical protein [Streptomyces swartbergensis]
MRQVERERWSASELAHGVPHGPATSRHLLLPRNHGGRCGLLTLARA